MTLLSKFPIRVKDDCKALARLFHESSKHGVVLLRSTQSRHRRTAQPAKRSLKIASQYLDGAGHLCFSGGSKPVCIGSSDKDCAGAEADCRNDVASPPDASIHQYFDLTRAS